VLTALLKGDSHLVLQNIIIDQLYVKAVDRTSQGKIVRPELKSQRIVATAKLRGGNANDLGPQVACIVDNFNRVFMDVSMTVDE
jgi:hypothetical protein